ncbi:MAG: sugar ABC transporter substrate-binding protein [Acidimicrobiales bacterium]
MVALMAALLAIAAGCSAGSSGTAETGSGPGSPEPAPAGAGTSPEGLGQPVRPGPDSDVPEIGVMVWNTEIPFYARFIDALEDSAADQGVTVTLRNGQGDLAEEIAVIDQFVTDRVDALIVTPSDAEGITAAVQRAVAAGIPVIAANNRVGDDGGALTFVGADDVEFGRQQAQLLVSAMGPEGRVAVIQGRLGTSPQILREQGFTEELAQYPGIEIVATRSADWAAEQAVAVVQDWLVAFGEHELDAIVGQGPEGVAAAEIIHAAGRDDLIVILGDYPSNVRDAIAAGTVYGTINQDPYPQAYLAVELAVQVLGGDRDLAPNHYLPLPRVTAENVHEIPPAWGG